MTRSSTRLSILIAAELLLLSLPAITQDARAPIPEKDAQEEVRKLLEVLFEEEFARRSTPEGRLMLLDKLLIQAERTNDDLTAKYVLFAEAREIAVMSGEIDRALKAVDGLGKTFRVDTVFEKTATLETLRDRARSNNLRKAVIESQIKVSIEAEAQDRYSVAHDLLTTASRSAKRLRSNELLQDIEKRLSSITVLRKEYEAVKKAETLLQANVVNAQAHLTIGRFRCFLKAQWKVGLPHLAKGSDETLRDLAELDLSGGTGTQDQVKLGDGWWKEGNKGKRPISDAYPLRGWRRLLRSSSSR